MRFAAPRWFPALALALLLPACFSDGGAQGTATGPVVSTSSTGSTATDTTTGDGTTSTGATTTTGTTASATTAIDPTATTTDPGTGTAPATTSTGPASTCDDPGPEPNEDQGSAVKLPGLGCGGAPVSHTGILDGDVDADWFTLYAAGSNLVCGDKVSDLRLAVDLGSTEPLRLCVTLVCVADVPLTVTCPEGATAIMSGDTKGCCSSDSMQLGVNCLGPDDDMRVFVGVDQAPADTCTAYEITHTFDQP